MMEQLLEYVQKSNPDMDMDRLMAELSKSDYSSRGLVNTFIQSQRQSNIQKAIS